MSRSLPLVTLSPLNAQTVKPPTLDVKLCVGQAFISVVKGEAFRGKWLTASCLLKLIKQRYAFRDDSDFDVPTLNKAILKVNQIIDTHDETNTTGQFRLQRSLTVDDKLTRVYFCYITDQGKPYIGDIPRSRDGVAWKVFYDRAQAAGEGRLTRSRARAKKSCHWDDVDNALLVFHSLTTNLQLRLNEVIPAYKVPTYWEHGSEESF
jgi:hypothetical protein